MEATRKLKTNLETRGGRAHDVVPDMFESRVNERSGGAGSSHFSITLGGRNEAVVNSAVISHRLEPPEVL
jgi:hypothetical protein